MDQDKETKIGQPLSCESLGYGVGLAMGFLLRLRHDGEVPPGHLDFVIAELERCAGVPNRPDGVELPIDWGDSGSGGDQCAPHPAAAAATGAASAAAAMPAAPPDECPGHGRGGTAARCCDRAGEYNGSGSDGPLAFRCPRGCSCHD